MATISEITVQGGVLVAHDGSDAATAALRTAVRCAPVFGGSLHVVRAWSFTSAPVPDGMEPGFVPSIDEFEAGTLASLERDIAEVVSENPDVTISAAVVHGNVAEKLIDASSNVELIVLGSRGRGGFAGLLLGSTSDQVSHHAKCRVLIDR